MKQPTCHKCPHNGKGDNACLSCRCDEQYAYPYAKLIKDGYEPPAPEPEDEPESLAGMQTIDDDQEQTFKNRIIELFSMSPNELLLIRAVMNNMSLTEYAEDMERLSRSNSTFTRQRAYETRRTLITKA